MPTATGRKRCSSVNFTFAVACFWVLGNSGCLSQRPRGSGPDWPNPKSVLGLDYVWGWFTVHVGVNVYVCLHSRSVCASHFRWCYLYWHCREYSHSCQDHSLIASWHTLRELFCLSANVSLLSTFTSMLASSISNWTPSCKKRSF